MERKCFPSADRFSGWKKQHATVFYPLPWSHCCQSPRSLFISQGQLHWSIFSFSYQLIMLNNCKSREKILKFKATTSAISFVPVTILQCYYYCYYHYYHNLINYYHKYYHCYHYYCYFNYYLRDLSFSFNSMIWLQLKDQDGFCVVFP